MAADGSVIIEILGDSKEFAKTLSSIAGGAVKGLTTAIAGVSTALGGVTAAAIKVGSEFESSMSQVAATMGLSVEEIQSGSEAFEILSNAAKEAGATTAFSASEAAAGLNYLALAGYDAATAAEVLPSVLNLAAAGGMDLAYASDLATDAMAALGIEASNENLTQFGDQMAKTASKANTSVAQLGEAILTVGGTAKGLAGGTVELNAALGVLANRGIKGAEGGTALRNMILSLSAPTDTAAKLMDQLGLVIYDATGNMRPLNEVFQDLNAAMSDMTEGEKTNVLSEIFNKVDLKSAQALLAGTGAEFDALADAIENSRGAMQNMADVQLDNLNGDITILKSGLDGLGIALYETMQVNARSAVQSITGAVGEISSALNGGDAVLRADGSAYWDTAKNRVTSYEERLSTAIRIAGQQIAGFAASIASQAPGIIDAGVSLIQSFLQGIRENAPQLATAAGEIVTSLMGGLVDLLPDLIDTGATLVVSLAEGLAQALPELIPATVGAVFGIADTLLDNADLVADAAIDLMLALVDGIVDAVPVLIEKAPDIIIKFNAALIQNAPKLIAGAGEMIVKLNTGLVKALPKLLEKAEEIPSLIYDTFEESGEKIKEIGENIATGIAEGIKAKASEAVEKAKELGENILNGIKEFFDINSPSGVMRDEVGAMIGEGIAKGISASSAAAVKSAEELSKNVSDTLQGLVDTYEDAWGEAVGLQNHMFSDLAGTGELFERTASGNIKLLDLQNDIDEINAYGEAIHGLRDRMAWDSLMDEVISMSMEDATAFANALLSMSDDEYAAYLDLWQKKQEAAERVSSSFYANEFQNLQTEFSDEIANAAEQLPEELRPIGAQAIQALTDGMEEKGAEAIAAAEEIADEVAAQLARISDLSDRLRSAVEAEAIRISAGLTVYSNAPVEAAAARDSRVAAQTAQANAASVSGDLIVQVPVNGVDLAQATLQDFRKVGKANPEVIDDE